MTIFYVSKEGAASKVANPFKEEVAIEASSPQEASKLVMSPDKRFLAVPYSPTGHCCFEAAVVDFGKPRDLDHFYTPPSVVECFDLDMANLVAAMLNNDEWRRLTESELDHAKFLASPRST